MESGSIKQQTQEAFDRGGLTWVLCDGAELRVVRSSQGPDFELRRVEGVQPLSGRDLLQDRVLLAHAMQRAALQRHVGAWLRVGAVLARRLSRWIEQLLQPAANPGA